MKRHASLIVFTALVLALGLWLWLDRDRASSSEEKQRRDNVFVVWRKEQLTSISIVHDDETIVLERRDDRWRLTAPRAEVADPAAVDRLLATLEVANVQRRASTASGLGLETPRASGQVVMGGLTTRFALGGASPKPEGSSYFRVDEGAPVVVGKELEAALLAPADTYRDRTVVPYLATDLQAFEASFATSVGYHLERIDERTFRVSGAGLLAARGAVDGLWAALAEMRAEAFPKDADVERLTKPPVATVTLTPKDPNAPKASLVIGKACPGHPDDVVVLRTAPTRVAACAPKDVLERLDIGLDGIIEHRPFSFRADEVEELRLERIADVAELGKAVAPDAPALLEIARKGNGFHQRFPQDRDLSPGEAEAGGELLANLATAKTGELSSSGVPEPFRAIARARLHGGEHEETIEVGPLAKDGSATLRRLLDGARLAAGPVLVRMLLPRSTTLRPHAIVASEEVRKPARVVLRCGVAQELVDHGEGFRLVTPQGFEADGSIGQLVDAILRGRVDPWVADGDDGTFGFSSDGCHVVIAFEDEKAPLTVWFGAAAPASGSSPAGTWARIDTRPGVFVAPASLRELAGRLFVSRGSLRSELSRVEHVRATYLGRPVLGDEDTLRSAVTALYADRVIALGRKEAGPPDLVLDVVIAEGGTPRRISCRKAAKPGEHECTTPAVDATFALADARLTAFLPGAPAGPDGGLDGGVEAGVVARDGGAR